ncbi:transcription termination/antitermination protein NusA [endosymbiont of Sipalinus gigas]|uniref:NusA N-terminal domain-containing protein n=1 Tax=endosymbiont of Sipalinus gigas TaxID=1972134 RepID=UPI000DC6DA17|nr:NusA N-terminal domain-containing protein [endosymbiont of Sipalinus gigas]BBA85375.1 transcription termination/antitermination protein NusA [endosymbiont of Sipalinus gigas]
MNKKILVIVESISNKNLISKDKVFEILKDSLLLAINKTLKNINNIEVYIDKNSGDIKFYKKIYKNLTESNCNNIYNNLINKNILKEEINIKFNRILIELTKKNLIESVKKISNNILFNKFNKLIGKLILGIVKKISKNYILIYIEDNIDAILNKNNMLNNDSFKLGDKITGILFNVIINKYDIELFISRTSNKIIYELFYKNINSENKNYIKIISIIRNPGYISKIIIKLKNKLDIIFNNILNKKINRYISNELSGEKIDIIIWNNDIKKLIFNIIFPIKILKININKYKLDIFIKKDNNIFFLKNKNNIKLLSKLCKYKLNFIY